MLSYTTERLEGKTIGRSTVFVNFSEKSLKGIIEFESKETYDESDILTTLLFGVLLVI